MGGGSRKAAESKFPGLRKTRARAADQMQKEGARKKAEKQAGK